MNAEEIKKPKEEDIETRVKMNAKEIKAYWNRMFWINVIRSCPSGVFFVIRAVIETKVDKINAKFWGDIHAAHSIPLNVGIRIETKTMELVFDRPDIKPEPQKKTSRKKK